MSSEKEKLSREEKKVLSDLRIITAISLGKARNKELARLLDTDKSFASKKVKKLCEQGLVFKEGEGKETRYTVNQNKVLEFLKSKIVLKWTSKQEVKNMNESKSNMS